MLGIPTTCAAILLWASFKKLIIVDALIPVQLSIMAGVMIYLLTNSNLAATFEMRFYQSLISYSFYMVVILFQTAVWSPF